MTNHSWPRAAEASMAPGSGVRAWKVDPKACQLRPANSPAATAPDSFTHKEVLSSLKQSSRRLGRFLWRLWCIFLAAHPFCCYIWPHELHQFGMATVGFVSLAFTHTESQSQTLFGNECPRRQWCQRRSTLSTLDHMILLPFLFQFRQ